MSAHHRHFAGIFIMSMLLLSAVGVAAKPAPRPTAICRSQCKTCRKGWSSPMALPCARGSRSRRSRPGPVHHELNVPATAEADPAKMAKISPPLPGRVVKLLVRLGEAVKQGAPLFTLDSPDLVAAQTDYLKARSAEAQANRAVARQKDLVSTASEQAGA